MPDPMPERQSARAPDGGDATIRAGDANKRRLAYAASILTTPGGALGSPATTSGGAKTVLGA